jgi:hypothetical protein
MQNVQWFVALLHATLKVDSTVAEEEEERYRVSNGNYMTSSGNEKIKFVYILLAKKITISGLTSCD